MSITAEEIKKDLETENEIGKVNIVCLNSNSKLYITVVWT